MKYLDAATPKQNYMYMQYQHIRAHMKSMHVPLGRYLVSVRHTVYWLARTHHRV